MAAIATTVRDAAPGDVESLTRALVDIDSTTGREQDIAEWLSAFLLDRDYRVTEQPIADGRFNVFAHLDAAPRVVFSTHFDCVPPYMPFRQERGMLFGRGSCDAKGILAAQVMAVEHLRASGESRVGMLFVAGEERGSDGARVANDHAPDGVEFLINGEPTDNRLGLATRGVLRVRLRARGRAAHSSFPELGESAIDKLLDALMVLRGVALPEDALLGRTHYTVGLIEGGVAPNVVSPHASAELLFRIVGESAPVREALHVIEQLVTIEPVLDMPAVRLHTLPGFETAVFPYTTDVPLLTRWGTPLLLGPGSIHVAHTDDEHVSIDELKQAVELYERVARQLLGEC
ncbi:MAG TPA: M20/M25/M40 family metallo-hydrolase [Vicinamibacterales bacterium]|nr:M20/M25/M40 family metallo-hydrolase [Vicinamibacterales bacterium]